MMGSEIHGGFVDTTDEMETLALEDGDGCTNKVVLPANFGKNGKSYDDYRSAMTSLDGETHHPLASEESTDSDPLLSPKLYRDLNPKRSVNDNSSSTSSYPIEPPAYSDVVFRPFDDAAAEDFNNLESSSRLSESPRSPSFSSLSGSEYIKISVSNPQKESESANSLVPGGTTYITYLITTITNIPDFNGSEFSVRRRFRDVVTLADRLAETYRGFFIPPRPDKNVVESQVMQKQEFVEQRRVSLEKYLRRLGAHPIIKKSDELRAFLQAQGKLPLHSSTDMASRMLDGAVKLPKQLFGDGASSTIIDVGQPAKGGRDLLRMFKELKQSVANDWGGSRPPVIEEDAEFLLKREKMIDIEQQLSNASQQAELLVKAQQDIGETMGELGLAFIKLTKFENEKAIFNSQRVRAADMKNIATAAVKASRFYRELNSQTVKHLDTLHEYLGLMLAVHAAFADRSNALLTVQTLVTELSTLHSKAEKLEAASSKIFGGDKSRLRKIEELKESISATEAAKNVATREYERIKENNKSELERLERARHADLLCMMKGFVLNQVGYAEKIASVWAKVADETRGYAKEKM